MTYITETPDATLSAEFALNSLADGILKHVSGVPARAVPGTDYEAAGVDLRIANNLSDLNSASTARTNLGGTTAGQNLFTLANPSAVRFLQINADNSVTAQSASSQLTALGGVATTRNVNTTSPLGGGGALSSDLTLTCSTCTTTIASGTSALGTSAIASGACATVVTTSATGTATTDTIGWGFNGNPTSTTGYQASANGMLTIIAYPSTNNVNFLACNNTSASITPGAITLNWKVTR
nr:hypothetical protein [uncultured bacterium]